MKTETAWKWAAAGAGVFWVSQGIRWLRGIKKVPVLRPAATPQHPVHKYDYRLAIIVPACNEGATVAAGVGSILAHAPEEAMVVALDDRSTDATGAALDTLSRTHPRLHVLHLQSLPQDWLGKTHAIWQGARAARRIWQTEGASDWFLFTDADVVYENGGIQSALEYAQRESLGHLTLLPGLLVYGFWEAVFTSAFTFLFGLRFRLWQVNDPNSTAFVGIGAFNLVRAEDYNRMGTHRVLALDVADDVRLGEEMRRAGARQNVAFAPDLLKVRWQTGLWGLITGLEKNGFAGVGYSVPNLIGSTAGMLLLASPFAGVFLTEGWARGANAAALAMIARIYREAERQGGPPWPYFATYPLGTALFLVAIWRSALLALWRGGIVWRGTFYPLEELRLGAIPAAPETQIPDGWGRNTFPADPVAANDGNP